MSSLTTSLHSSQLFSHTNLPKPTPQSCSQPPIILIASIVLFIWTNTSDGAWVTHVTLRSTLIKPILSRNWTQIIPPKTIIFTQWIVTDQWDQRRFWAIIAFNIKLILVICWFIPTRQEKELLYFWTKWASSLSLLKSSRNQTLDWTHLSLALPFLCTAFSHYFLFLDAKSAQTSYQTIDETTKNRKRKSKWDKLALTMTYSMIKLKMIYKCNTKSMTAVAAMTVILIWKTANRGHYSLNIYYSLNICRALS